MSASDDTTRDDRTPADPVKVHARLTDPDGPDSESFWAEPVDATDAGGTYRVGNVCFFAPFVPGDLVTCTLDPDSRYQVTALTASRPVYAAMVALTDADGDDDGGGDERARALEVGRQLEEAGAQVEFAHPRLLVAVADGDWLVAHIEKLVSDGTVTDWELTRVPGEPVDVSDVDFTVPTEPTIVAHTTGYWAPEDPFWAAAGLDDPDFLAYVQQAASDDARVAHALENGRHDQVLRFLHRSAAIAAGEDVPPLDGPIFTDD